jgi:hypothetical protein
MPADQRQDHGAYFPLARRAGVVLHIALRIATTVASA